MERRKSEREVRAQEQERDKMQERGRSVRKRRKRRKREVSARDRENERGKEGGGCLEHENKGEIILVFIEHLISSSRLVVVGYIHTTKMGVHVAISFILF